MNQKLLLLFFITISVLSSCKKEDTLFTQLTAEDTGITFSNRIIENDTMNVLEFEYVYNGGGVALGDFNNDNLTDIYFTGNQVANKLYLNKGTDPANKLKFEDVTAKANVAGDGKWCSGVAVVDINNDNLLDIYVCATVKDIAAERTNMLYVNQGVGQDGVPTFKEMAKEYGIDDSSHTTNAAFFDYDNDGDLDLYVLINEMEDIRFPNKYHDKIVDGSSKRTDKLFRNDWDEKLNHAVFTDISKQAGILIEGYGLGINITDINRDGWKDIYVTNDYLTNDLLYINNHNGTFKDQAHDYFKHTSYSAMGNDVADLNNDGLVDILAVDMMPADNYRKKMMLPPNNYLTYQNNDKFGYDYQYPRNTLQMNQGMNPKTGKPVFSEIGLLAGVAETDWSWTPMATDFDNDGLRDIIITNGFPRDITDQDFMIYRAEMGNMMTKLMLLDSIPSVKITDYAFRNKGNFNFEDVSKSWGLTKPSFSNGAAYGDLDNDGDLDYVTNNINDSASVYRNNLIETKPAESNYLRLKLNGNDKNIGGLGAFVEIKYQKGLTQIYENSPYRGYLSTIENIVHFGLGKNQIVDEVKVTWQSGKVQILKNVKANQVLNIYEKNAGINLEKKSNKPTLFEDISDSLNINYTHTEKDAIDFNIQKLMPHKFSQFGPAIAVGDVNGDGLEDVFIGGPSDQKGTFLLQNQSGKFTKADLIANETNLTKPSEDMGVLLFDADSDNDLDLYIVSGSYEYPNGAPVYQDRYYENDGKGNFTQKNQAIPAFLKSGSCVKAADYDKDGDLDLFIGGRVEVASYPKPVSSYILRNDSKPGQPKFTDVTTQVAKNLQNIGLVCDATWTDYNNDGWVDLMLAGEWMPITILKNNQGKLEKLETPNDLDKQVGFWNSITTGDFDDDGDIDYIVGNFGKNSLFRASDIEPVTIYGKDFNSDGNYDAIPSVYYKSKEGESAKREVPFNGKDDLSKQLITMRKKFVRYNTLGLASIKEVLSEEDLKDALILKANYLKTSFVENLGNDTFKIKALPMEAQTAPVLGMLTEDFDNDGNLDVLMVGNDFGAEVSVGRYDAFNGLFLKGNGKGDFKATTLPESAFVVLGDAKGLVKVKNPQGKTLIMATQNRGDLKTFQLKNNSFQSKSLQNDDITVLETFKNGKTRRVEISYGSSFLSQSSRSILINSNIKSVEVINSKGKKRTLLLNN